MSFLKKILIATILMIVILWGLKFTSTNIRIEGYSGLVLEYFFPKHDTVFAEDYSDEAFLAIKKGMTEREVLNILGEPLARWDPEYKYLGLEYSNSKGSTHYKLRQIYLLDDKVEKIIGYYYID